MALLQWRDIANNYSLKFVGVAAFPRLAHRLRWPTRLGPRGLAAYVAAQTLFLFALRQFVVPYCKRAHDEVERAKAELRQRLGHEPTDREVFEHLGLPYLEP